MLFSAAPVAPVRPSDAAGFGHAADAEGESAGRSRRLIIVPPPHPLRAAAEACIRGVYEQVYGADGLEFPGTLIAWASTEGLPMCAAGLRTCGDGFFSEIYLDAPIERLLTTTGGTTVRREAVIEVTTLASRRTDLSASFLFQLAGFCRGAGFDWCFFTATERLRSLLRRLGIPTVELAPADPARVRAPERWGSYYQHAPLVCAVHSGWLGAVAARWGTVEAGDA